MKLQIEEFILKKALKTLTMNWTDTDPWMSEKLLIRGKSCFYYSILTLTNLRYSMFYTIPCLTRRCTDQITRHRQQKNFLDHMYTKFGLKDEFLMVLMKLRLDFLFTNFFSKIFSITYVLKFLNSWAWEEMIQIICDVKSDVICLHNRYGKSISIHNQNIRS